jgi:AP-3 complex subunit delta-1
MLTTNLIRKDLHAGGLYDSGVALGGLACFVTTDLSRDLAPDIVNLVSGSRGKRGSRGRGSLPKTRDGRKTRVN